MLPKDRARPAERDKSALAPGSCRRWRGPRPGGGSTAGRRRVVLPGHARPDPLCQQDPSRMAGRLMSRSPRDMAPLCPLHFQCPPVLGDSMLLAPSGGRGRSARWQAAGSGMYRVVRSLGTGVARTCRDLAEQLPRRSGRCWRDRGVAACRRRARLAAGQERPGRAPLRGRTRPGEPGHSASGGTARRHRPASRGPATPATPGRLATASGLRPRRCRTARAPAATSPARPGRGRRSRSRTRWPSSRR